MIDSKSANSPTVRGRPTEGAKQCRNLLRVLVRPVGIELVDC
jgi:hypothetical protein